MDEAPTLAKTGRYQIVRELGRGSMGVVYQGYDPVIGRTVAIKTMLTEGLAPQEFQEFKARFQREAQAAGALAHPNIVTVYDFGEDAGVLYLAMEFLEGKSLDAIVQEQGILPIETIIPTYEQVCSALDDAHAHKIVHRDIKPANIMILDTGLVKVTDFGIAKMMSLGMTQAGQILGTPNYMSPEQVKGRQVDGRSDIFSLGVILYELVTGEKPFGGQNITTVIYKIINENPIPPRELDATIHPGLSYVISKALAKNPEERYQTCRELAEDLKGYRNLGGVTPPSATVVIRVPPVQAPQPEFTPAVAPPPPAPQQAVPAAVAAPAVSAPAAQPPARQVSVQVIPPPKTHQGTSPVVWVLLTLAIVAVLGGGYYFFHFVLHHPEGTRVTENIPQPAIPPAQPGTQTTQPGTQTTQPGTQTTQPATQPPATGQTTAPPPAAPTTTESKPQPVEAPPKPERAKPEEELGGGPPLPGGKPSKGEPAPKVGQLLVTSNIPGAMISIDGRSNPGWVTPHDAFRDVSAGTHQVVVSKEGYDDWQQSVTIEGGKTNSITAHLTAPTGEITIVTSPPGVEVLIDGKSYGPSPVRATLTAGAHKYTIPRAGAEPYEKTFTLKSGAVKRTEVDLGGSAASTGIVEVRTIPLGATVRADGALLPGQTPTSFRLTIGHHTLIVSLPGFQSKRLEVDVTAEGIVEKIPLSPQ
jgi:serine/threonine-protein kinase